MDERTAAAQQAAQALTDKQAEYDASLARCKSQMGAMQLLDGGGSITLLMQAQALPVRDVCPLPRPCGNWPTTTAPPWRS